MKRDRTGKWEVTRNDHDCEDTRDWNWYFNWNLKVTWKCEGPKCRTGVIVETGKEHVFWDIYLELYIIDI